MPPSRIAIALTALLCWASSGSGAPIVMDGPTTDWIPITYPTLIPDFYDDEQTGDTEADVVGNASRPALYMQFDDGGTPGDLTDGNIAFRLRLGAQRSPPGFSRFAAVGMDADLDGALDLFIGVDNQGSSDHIEIYHAGSGANTSPDTTTIVCHPNPSPPPSCLDTYSYTPTVSNYDWSPVDATIEPGESNFDLDADGNTDYFLSWLVPFNDIVTLLSGAPHFISIDENSPVQYVAGTSTQDNALNQDLGGPDGGTDSSLTWDELGALSDPYTPTGVLAPEPASATLLLIGLLGLAAGRSRGGR
jgi:hypothetical protein